MFLIIILYALLASTFTLGKVALLYFQPCFLTGIRMVVAGLLLLTYLYFFDRKQLRLHLSKDWPLFGQAILFHIYFTFVLEFWALQYITSSKACLLFNLSPFITALFSYFWFGEIMTFKKLVGLCIGFAGFIPILISENSAENLLSVSFFSWAEIVLLLSVIASVYGWILVKTLVTVRHYSPFMINGLAMFGGGILSLITSFIFETKPIILVDTIDISKGLLYVALLILIANIIYYNLYGHLLRQYSATFLAFVGFICPLFAGLFGWLFLAESIGWAFFISVFVVAIGLYIYYREEVRQGYIEKTNKKSS